MTSVEIPNSVSSIENFTFNFCYSLTSVVIPNSVTSIGNCAFNCCYGLSSVELSNSVTSIGEGAFRDCYGLTTVKIPNSITSLANNVFLGCRDLRSVQISSIETLLNAKIGGLAWGENKLELYLNDQRVTELTVPGTVKKIKANALYPFMFDKIVLEDGVEVIEDNALCNDGTRVLELGKSVKSIGTMFNDVTMVKCHAATPPTIKEGAFQRCTFDNENPGVIVLDTPEMEAAYLAAPVWKDLMTSDMTNKVEVTVETPGKLATEIIYAGSAPAKVVGLKINGTINETDFERMRINMMALIDLDLTDLNSTTMPAGALQDKFQLESLKLPKNCTEIEAEALSGCSGLTNITLPSTITTIRENALNGCSALRSITLPTELTEICEGAFKDCSGLQSVVFNSKLTTIGNSAFANAGLKRVDFNSGLTSIGDEAFVGCQLNQELLLPENLQTIGGGAFRGQAINGHLTLPESVQTVCNEAFAGTEISTVSLNSSLTELSSSVFENCKNLNTINVPDNITAINYRAFAGCESLANLRFSPTLTEIGAAAFQATALHSAILPDGITAVEDETFDQCTNLRTASIPNGVTRIGDGAFRGCGALRNLTVKAVTPPAINSSVFLGVNTNLCIISIPTVSFEDYALSNYWGRFVQMRNDIAVETEGEGTITFDNGNEENQNGGATNAPANMARAKAQTEANAEAENGSSVFVPKGGKILFYISPAEGKAIVSATYDGEDVKPLIKDGVFTATADKRGAKLKVVFGDASAAIYGIAADKSLGGKTYNLSGQPVGDDYKGIVIQNGKKILKK